MGSVGKIRGRQLSGLAFVPGAARPFLLPDPWQAWFLTASCRPGCPAGLWLPWNLPLKKETLAMVFFFGGWGGVFAASLGHEALSFQGWKRKGQKETRF